ncbi:HEAT repeat domain-containing protein [Aquirufa rosea]|uniref:C-type cytochrome n=1 Tax=Aquirufa rosea TaxID=2509241 RepID=A0A4Q1C2T2_9BACT|nr:HEAT repeat domain-containing protein [Aquirufa rosea]RXK52381.1 c-type cytochrome [Aquirufa rosea]
MKLKYLLALVIVSAISYSCRNQMEKDTYRVILEDQDNLAEKARIAKEKSPIKIAPGLQITRFASDSLAPDPVAMDIDDKGAIYITRTNRGKYSEFDIRGHRDWMTESIGFQSVADRKAFLHKTFATENSEKNNWLPDLNNDGVHDVNDLKVEKEEIWKIEDKNGDGLADQSTRIFNGFHEEYTDVAGGILMRKKDAFIAVGPDLWRLKNTKKNGLLTDPVSISTGYGVHIGFGGHGMSGVIEGPDGKIYWQIGDIGANITAVDGKQYKYPNSGVIVRSNPDGSNFEVFASGLRNTHEFVFDHYGNLISSDNDGDHPGESERLVHVVEGSDAGWRSNWQYGKYTDPSNNLYKVWMDEKLYVPRWKGQAAYIIPPIRNYHNGPTGMLFNPGTALGKKWTNKFFLVEFVGNPNASHIWSFDLKPKGASFDFKSEEDIVSGILPTGMRFGPDGALYAADWVYGWDVKHFGRVWKIDVDTKNNDLEKERAETKRLIQLDYEKQSPDMLYDLLFYNDMRVRQKAQFELAKRGKASVAIFQKAIQQRENQLARIHGIWGIGQLGASDALIGSQLGALLNDPDEEIIAQGAKVLGDIFNKDHEDKLIQLLNSKNSRINFFACQALGRIKSEKAIPGLLSVLEKNNDEDHYIRHAAVLALSRIGKEEPIVALAKSNHTALKTAAVLVLRRLSSPQLALFLQDSDEYIATEAARAINDDESVPAALPALAAALNNKAWKGEPLLRRAINACLRVGGTQEIDALIQFSERNDNSDVIRAEAIATLGSWANPSVLDRVDGRHRGVLQRNPADVVERIYPKVANFLRSSNPEVLIATAKLLSELKIKDFRSEQTQIFLNHPNAKVRSAQLASLVALNDSHLALLVQKGMNDADRSVRGASLSFLNKIDFSKAQLPHVVNPIIEKGSVLEQQQLLQSIGKMPVDKTEDVLADLIEKMIAKKLSNDIRLDLVEAVEASNSQKLVAKLDALKTKGTLTDEFKDALFGGNIQAGNSIFYRNQIVQCVRCHNAGGEGGIVGPSLKGIGNRLSREQILQALIEPSARIAPGYGTITLKLTDGQEVSGTVISENESLIQLKTSEAEPLKIATSRIKSRENSPSSMPPMGSLMSKREIRDVVEFLSSLRN